MTYYDILEVTETASDEVIKMAYKALVKKYHPDTYSGNSQHAEFMIKRINSAYEVLGDADKRKNYDIVLKNLRNQQSKETNSENNNIYTSSKYSNEPQMSTRGCLEVIVILIICGIILSLTLYFHSADSKSNSVSNSMNNTVIDGIEVNNSSTDSKLKPVSEPVSGTIIDGKEVYNASEIKVTASSDESCVVKLKDMNGVTQVAFYVRAGETVRIQVPLQKLQVFFASGKIWYGEELLFGKTTSYSKDDDFLDFSQYTWEYTLYPVTNGNFSETPIDADEF